MTIAERLIEGLIETGFTTSSFKIKYQKIAARILERPFEWEVPVGSRWYRLKDAKGGYIITTKGELVYDADTGVWEQEFLINARRIGEPGPELLARRFRL